MIDDGGAVTLSSSTDGFPHTSRARTRVEASNRDPHLPFAFLTALTRGLTMLATTTRTIATTPRPLARARATRGRAIDRRARASLDDGRVTTSDGVTVDRRSLVGFAFATASVVVATTAVPGRADALLQPNDEDDEALLAKAKANRQQRIQSETAKGKKYVNDTGLKLDADGTAMQTAVYKLSKAGARVRAGALDEAADGLNGDWIRTAVASAKSLGANDGVDAFESGVEALKAACESGDDARARRAYVDAAKALKAVAESAGVANKLRLL